MRMRRSAAPVRSHRRAGADVPRSRRRLRAVAAVGALALTLSTVGVGATALLAAAPAQAAPGDPFDAADPYVFVAQGTPTQLFRALTDASGTTSFQPEGEPADLSYNAIAYNPADNYIYAITSSASATIPASALIRIGQDGEITQVGDTTLTGSVLGTFGPADGHLYTVAGVDGVSSLQIIDVTAGTVADTIPLTGDALPAYDLAYKDGYLWAMGAGFISRTDPSSGATTRWEIPFETELNDQGGAAWTYGNGNLGFSYNASGTVYQVAVADAASATPTFTLVSSNPGPSSANNDGTSSPGLPTDLSVVKDGPAALVPGGTATYTLTVTNHGAGNSSGFVVDDSVPAALTDVQIDDEGCTVTGNDVRCVGGRLLADESATYTITASVPADVTGAVENTATVTSNEVDPDPTDNSSSSSGAPARIAVVKNAGTPADLNGNGITDVGDTIQYTFDVTNTGEVPLTGITVNDEMVGAVTCASTTLGAGVTQTCAADAVYTVTEDDVAAGAVDNTATVTGTTPDGDDITSEPSTTSTETTAPAPGITVVKSADPSDAGAYAPGQEITYHFVVTNTGNVPLSDVAVAEGEFTGTGDLSDVVCPSTTLAAGAQQVCEATYTLTQADVDAGEVTNSATASGTPADGTPVVSEPSETTVSALADPGISVVKTADPSVVVQAGQTVTYSFVVTNTGNVTLADVGVDEGEFSGTGELSAVDCPTPTLVAGQTTTCTATYEVTQADVDAGGLTNTATVGGTTPAGDPVTSEESTSTVEAPHSPSLAVVKTADAEVAEVGATITYSFAVTNTGNVTVDDVAVAEGEFSGTGELSAVECPEDTTLAPGETVNCTATYEVTQADVDSGELTNTATAGGTTPSGDPVSSPPSTSTVSTGPEPALTVVKTADVDRLTEAGQAVTYSFVVTNSGNVTITDVAVEEGEFTGHGELSEVSCPAEESTLAPGESTTCTAGYTVVADDLAGGAELANTATATGTAPGGAPIGSDPSTATVAAASPASPSPSPSPSGGAGPADGDGAGLGALPQTGVTIGGVVGAAALLLLLGLLAVRVARRRAEG